MILDSVIFLFLNMAFAIVPNPQGTYSAGRMFCAHTNTVFALETKNRSYDCTTWGTREHEPKVLWKTVLPYSVEPTTFNPSMEQDVQLCTISSLLIKGRKLFATNCRGQKFILDKNSGKLLPK